MLYELELDMKQYRDAYNELLEDARARTVTVDKALGQYISFTPFEREIAGIPHGELLQGAPESMENIYEYWRDGDGRIICVKHHITDGVASHCFIRPEGSDGRRVKMFEYLSPTMLRSVKMIVNDDSYRIKYFYIFGTARNETRIYHFDDNLCRLSDISRLSEDNDLECGLGELSESRVHIIYSPESNRPAELVEIFDNGEEKRLWPMQ